MPSDISSMTGPPVARTVDEGLAHLAEFGVTLHEGFVSDDEADALRDRLEEQAYMERINGLGIIGGPSGSSGRYRTSHPEAPIFQGLPSLVNKGRVFIDTMMSPTGHAYAKGLFGAHPWQLWGMNGLITRNGAKAQLVHTDALMLPWDMSTIPVLVNCFICVTDFDEDMGPTEFVLGSHTRQLKYDGDHETPRVPGVARKGSALIWDGRTWHGQGEHRSPRDRYAIAMSYSLWVYKGGENYPASLHDDVYETLTDDERAVLGFTDQLGGYMNRFGPRSADDRRAPIGTEPMFVPEMHRE